MRHHLELELTDSPAAFPRLVACLHARGLVVERAQVIGCRCSLTVSGTAPAERVVASLGRLVDVLSVERVDNPARTDVTRCVVTRQPSRRAATTPHPWARGRVGSG
jgi:acetolactate synthase regulatory subunit